MFEHQYAHNIFSDEALSCSFFKDRSSCVSGCMKDGRVRCSWREADKSVTYETCTSSEDVYNCPNNVCDDLESQYDKMCPQDCASR